jgi:hypothetical protein
MRGGATCPSGSGDCPCGLWRAQPDRCLEVIGSPNLNPQSPSERWDGDCALG